MRRKNLIYILLVLLLSTLFAFLGLYDSHNKPGFRLEGENYAYIEDSSDFNDIFNTHNYKEKYILKNDITLTSYDSIGSSEEPFNSILDGAGYKIIIENMNKPLFNIIGSKGEIHNLELDVNNIEVIHSSFGILAKRNLGTISNINLTNNKALVKAHTVMGLICGVNEGSISNCYCRGHIEKAELSNIKKPIIGGICGYNLGKLDKLVAYVDYKYFNELDPSSKYEGINNESIGAIYGQRDKSSTINELNYIDVEGSILSDSLDTSNLALRDDLTLVDSFLLNYLKFDNRLWDIKIDKDNLLLFKVSLKDGVNYEIN